MEKTVEALRHSQVKSAELEKTNKKLYTQAHSDRKEIIKLKEENEVLKVKASRVDKLQVELNSQREQLSEANRFAPKLKVCKIHVRCRDREATHQSAHNVSKYMTLYLIIMYLLVLYLGLEYERPQ